MADNNTICGFVLAKDDFHKQADAARARDNDWHAPELYRSEFRSVARKHLVKGESADVLIQAGQLAALAVTTHTVTDAEVFAVLRESPKISSYDAEYVALARRLGCKLVTTDEQILKLFPDLVVSLEEFSAE